MVGRQGCINKPAFHGKTWIHAMPKIHHSQWRRKSEQRLSWEWPSRKTEACRFLVTVATQKEMASECTAVRVGSYGSAVSPSLLSARLARTALSEMALMFAQGRGNHPEVWQSCTSSFAAIN